MNANFGEFDSVMTSKFPWNPRGEAVAVWVASHCRVHYKQLTKRHMMLKSIAPSSESRRVVLIRICGLTVVNRTDGCMTMP